MMCHAGRDPTFRARSAARKKAACEKGQMTVELCVVFPVIIVIAVIATNAMLFFGNCAEFDRVGRNAVRTFAAVPAYGEDSGSAQAKVQSAIEEALEAENLDVSVSSSKDFRGYEEYVMTLQFHPTLFGMGLKQEVFGVAMPALAHESRIVVNPYKPGMLF